MRDFFLPQIVLDVGIELHGIRPAVGTDSLTDVLFVLWRHGTVTTMVFVVAFAVEVVDEVLLQRMGNTLGHVVVHLRDAKGHTYWLVVAVHGTRLGLHRRIVEVDAGGDAAVFRCKGTQLPAQAVLAQGT